jgi:hypothetical protein
VTADVVRAPALLVTHDCALDKKSARGVMQASEITFLPLRRLSSLEGNKQSIIRRNTLTPYDFLFVGELPGDLGESYVNLGSASTFSLDYFAPALVLEDGEEEAHLTASRHDHRLGRLTSEQMDLFLDKWNVHWTRRIGSREPA